MSSHLQGNKVDISLIQQLSRNNLLSLLEKCPGTKAIVWDNSLAGPVGLVAQYSVLKEHAVVKMFPLRAGSLPETNVKHVIFISRPKLKLMDLIAQNVHNEKNYNNSGSKKQYHLFFVPRKSLLCINKLQHSGMYGSLTYIEEFNCDLFPFDSDLLSMELPDAFREYALENDPTCLYQVAQAIVLLESIYGPIPRYWGKGQAASQVCDLVQRLKRENEPVRNVKPSTIDKIVLLDRSIDLITPLATQLTYEGLIDEIFGINNATALFPVEKFSSGDDRSPDAMAEDKKIIILNSADKLFADLRDKNFNAVGATLSKQAKLISSQLEDRHDKHKSVQEMKLFVQRLPTVLANKEALAKHTAIAECVKEITDSSSFLDCLQTEQEFLNCIEVDKANSYIEDLMAQGEPLMKVLRLICLQCLVSSGLKLKLLEYYKREIVQVYGLEALLAIINLEKVGLLRVQSSTRPYTVLRKALRLTMEDTSETNPTDISYVHSVYAPLSVRFTELLTKNCGWKHLQDVLGLLPGPTVDESPQRLGSSLSNETRNDEVTPSVVLVFFIGGCTFAEISALRFLSQQEDSNVEFVIATTKLINGNTFLQSIIDGS